MEVIQIPKALEQQHQDGDRWVELIRSRHLSTGLYVLAAGAKDLQEPHTEDEVYYVLSGRGRFRAGQDEQEIGPGSLIYVEAGLDHRFHSITEDLTVLVFFAPPEGALRTGSA